MRYIIILYSFTIMLSGSSSSQIAAQDNTTYSDLAIAYNIAVKDSSGKSNYEVFTMNIDGSDSKNISNSPAVDWTYRAYQKNLYFISDRDTCSRCYFLYKTDVDGENIKRVSGLLLEDSWMDIKDNEEEIVVSGRLGKEIRFQLFLINTSDGSYKQLTNDTSAYYRDPAFSPDGKQIAFVYRRDKRDKSIIDEIFVMNTDGSGLKQLTSYPKENVSYISTGYKAGSTHWHPTENFISYISMQNGRHNIYAVTPDGEKQWKLTDNNFSEGWHDWSPDGKWLTFDTTNEDENQYHIMLMDWITKEAKQLTGTNHRFQQSPVFLWK